MNTTTTVLSQQLKALGAKFVLYTTERNEGKVRTVQKGTPNTWGLNNGIMVVYDERGVPHLIPPEHQDELQQLADELSLAGGYYVPHSNDEGSFVSSAYGWT